MGNANIAQYEHTVLPKCRRATLTQGLTACAHSCSAKGERYGNKHYFVGET